MLDAPPTQRYTPLMRRQRISMLLLLLLAAALASCSPGHLGGTEIAFVRDGHLWTIDPDGANAFEVAADGPPVIGYGWSPDHHILVFRTLDSSLVSRHRATNSVTGLTGDVPSGLNTVGIDGGVPIPIIPSIPGIQHSNAWWNPTGNRLLYREEPTATTQTPGTVSWWVSQNDQPEGIARKSLPATFSIPSISVIDSMAIGNSAQGIFTTTLAGTDTQFIIHSVLPGHPLPAMLERVLWQPAHQNPAILYAVASDSTQPPTIQLLVRDPRGHITTIAKCNCTQFAWSPDGNRTGHPTASSCCWMVYTPCSSCTSRVSNSNYSCAIRRPSLHRGPPHRWCQVSTHCFSRFPIVSGHPTVVISSSSRGVDCYGKERA